MKGSLAFDDSLRRCRIDQRERCVVVFQIENKVAGSFIGTIGAERFTVQINGKGIFTAFNTKRICFNIDVLQQLNGTVGIVLCCIDSRFQRIIIADIVVGFGQLCGIAANRNRLRRRGKRSAACFAADFIAASRQTGYLAAVNSNPTSRTGTAVFHGIIHTGQLAVIAVDAVLSGSRRHIGLGDRNGLGFGVKFLSIALHNRDGAGRKIIQRNIRIRRNFVPFTVTDFVFHTGRYTGKRTGACIGCGEGRIRRVCLL